MTAAPPSFEHRPSATPNRRGSAGRLIVIALGVLVVGAVVAAVGWFSLVQQPANERLQEVEGQLQKMRVGSRVSNELDNRYADSDGNMIADPPADAAKQQDPPTLYFSYVTAGDATDFQIAFKDLMAAISSATGKPVEYVAFDSLTDQLRALRDGKLHVTAFNTGGVPIAVNAAGFVPVSLLAGSDNNGFYKMQIIAPADTDLKQAADLKSRELLLTDPGSNSGYKAPVVLLGDLGLQPGRDYEPRFSGSQDASIEQIAAKKYPAGAVASDVLKRAIGEGKVQPDTFKVIYESSDFPSAAIGYAYDLKPELAQKVRKCLTEFQWQGTSVGNFFASAGQNHFVPADYKKDWELVRRIDSEIGYAHRLPE